VADQDHPGSVVEELVTTPASAKEQDAVFRRAAPRRFSRFKFRHVVLVPLALLVIVGAVFLWRYFASYESTDDAQVDVHLYPVSARISGYVRLWLYSPEMN
jgi:membrane fusion protein, multidrug efflux system